MSFKDGGLLTIKDPGAEISGITFGDRVHNLTGQLIIIDHINKLEAVVTYNPHKPDRSKSSGMLRSFKNKLFNKKGENH